MAHRQRKIAVEISPATVSIDPSQLSISPRPTPEVEVSGLTPSRTPSIRDMHNDEVENSDCSPSENLQSRHSASYNAEHSAAWVFSNVCRNAFEHNHTVTNVSENGTEDVNEDESSPAKGS